MFRKPARRLVAALFWICVWAVAAKAVGQPLLLPSPWATATAFLSLAGSRAFWLSAGATVLRVFFGFCAGFVGGCALAALTARVRWARDLFAPVLSLIKATPVASFIVLALVWFRTDSVPVFATALIVLPVAFANLFAALTSLDADLMEMARAFRMRAPAVAAHIVWPQARPALAAAVASGMGMAWKAGVAAEVICTPKSALGSYMYSAKIYLDTPGLFAATAVVVALSVLLERAVLRLTGGRERRQNA